MIKGGKVVKDRTFDYKLKTKFKYEFEDNYDAIAHDQKKPIFWQGLSSNKKVENALRQQRLIEQGGMSRYLSQPPVKVSDKKDLESHLEISAE